MEATCRRNHIWVSVSTVSISPPFKDRGNVGPLAELHMDLSKWLINGGSS